MAVSRRIFWKKPRVSRQSSFSSNCCRRPSKYSSSWRRTGSSRAGRLEDPRGDLRRDLLEHRVVAARVVREAQQPARRDRREQVAERRLDRSVRHLDEAFVLRAREQPARRPPRPRRRRREAKRFGVPVRARSCRPNRPQLLQALVHRAAGGVLGAAHHLPDVHVGEVIDVSVKHRRPLLRQAARGPRARAPARRSGRRRRRPPAPGPPRPAPRGGERARCASIALRCAIVKSQDRRFDASRSRGYARSAEMNVSWKQSSASSRPSEATRKPVHVIPVLVEQRLEGRQPHSHLTSPWAPDVRSHESLCALVLQGMNAITVRPYLPDDRRSLERLAALDDRRVPAQPVVLAEADGRLVAALSRRTGEAVADPFEPTAHLVEMLRVTP